MRFEILDEAEKDLIDGFAFYERLAAGLGDYFLDSLYADLESLRLFAGIHSFHFGYYRLLAKRFPFAVYYRIQDDIVQIYAILDCRRDPAWIRKRLK
jgi:plasmid stabilization system protein ParE